MNAILPGLFDEKPRVEIVSADEFPRSGKTFLHYPVEDIALIYGGWKDGGPIIALITVIGTVERHPMALPDAIAELRTLGCTVTKRSPFADDSGHNVRYQE